MSMCVRVFVCVCVFMFMFVRQSVNWFERGCQVSSSMFKRLKNVTTGNSGVLRWLLLIGTNFYKKLNYKLLKIGWQMHLKFHAAFAGGHVGGWQSKIYKRLRFPLTAFQGLFDSFTKWLSPKMGRLSDLCWQPKIKFSRGFVFPFLFAEFEKSYWFVAFFILGPVLPYARRT